MSSAQASPWWADYSPNIPQSYIEYIEAEDAAVVHYLFNTSFVPGLLQTEAYARAAVRSAAPITHAASVAERLVKIRMERQWHILERADPSAIYAVIEESVLLRYVGGREVLREQLQHLLRLGELEHITIQVLPMTAGVIWPMFASSGFVLFQSPAGGTLADFFSQEIPARGQRNSREELEVSYYNLLFERFIEQALSRADSLKLIHSISQTLGQSSKDMGNR